MRFTDSPVIELPVGTSGALLSIQQDNNSIHVGTSVWPCSLVLVKFIERWQHIDTPNPYSHLFPLSTKRAIELGAGCGVAGMGLSLLGLSDILLTDTAPVIPALKRNLKRNRALFGPRKPPRHAQLYWNNPNHIAAARPPFDLVLAADVVYMEDSARWLVGAMEGLVGADGVVVLGYQLRSPEAHHVFWEMCVGRFDVEKVPHGDLHPEYAYEETDVYLLRRKKKEKEDEVEPSS